MHFSDLTKSFGFFLLTTVALLSPAVSSPKVLFIHGEQYYGSEKTIPIFAKQLSEKFGYEITVLTSPKGNRALPNLSTLEEADLPVLYIRLRVAPIKV
jgi:hypothetical protein|tara:strand:- start:232 stop:525 length:294 start_codon:yes stop_codon:yes gene_type:complete